MSVECLFGLEPIGDNGELEATDTLTFCCAACRDLEKTNLVKFGRWRLITTNEADKVRLAGEDGVVLQTTEEEPADSDLLCDRCLFPLDAIHLFKPTMDDIALLEAARESIRVLSRETLDNACDPAQESNRETIPDESRRRLNALITAYREQHE
jgi:hypothetical protein